MHIIVTFYPRRHHEVNYHLMTGWVRNAIIIVTHQPCERVPVVAQGSFSRTRYVQYHSGMGYAGLKIHITPEGSLTLFDPAAFADVFYYSGGYSFLLLRKIQI